MSRWTTQQQQAIDLRDKNLLISAAAGSGKTAVLVERIVQLMIESRTSIEEMLIVTFTNAAAGEMKERIQKKLQDKRQEILSDASLDVELADFLGKQIQNVSRAQISTVHSFCIKVIRDHFSLVNIDPAFKLVSESYGAILRENALDLALEEQYEKNSDAFDALVSGYSESKGDSSLRELIKNIDRFIGAQPYPEEWLSKQSEFYKKIAAAEDDVSALAIFAASPMGYALSDLLAEQLEQAATVLNDALDYIEGSNFSFEEKLTAEREQIAHLQNKLDRGLDIFFGEMEAATFERFSKKKSDEISDEEWEHIKALRNEAKKKITDITKDKQMIQLAIFLSDMKFLSMVVEQLVELVFSYRKIYALLKEEQSAVDFGDLEHLALRILENEEVRQSLRNKYRYIFYDEYQDTNLVQETIVAAIAQENNLFFVGDVKQSIYRFRLADPTIFNAKYDRYAHEEQSQTIDLSKNFRSRKEILNFCNLVFKQVMNLRYGEVNYANEAHQLFAGREDFSPYQDHIELAIIENSKKQRQLMSFEDLEKIYSDLASEETSASEDTDEELDLSAVELEAIYTAKKILQLTRQGVSYRDIAILFRSVRGKAKIFEKVLTSYGIPSFVDYTSSNYDKLEIKCLIDYLKIVDNRHQDEALIGVMSSIFGGFDNEELIEIRAEFPQGDFYLAAEQYAKRNNALGEKLRRFYQKLAQDTRREKMTSLDDFIWYVAENSGFNTYISGLEDSLQRLHNIRSLVQKAKEYETSEAMGLFGFLRHLDALLRGKADGDQSMILETDDVVKIMSIHKSKGLEFKTVFVCDLGKKINEQDLNADVILHNQLGIGLRYKNPILGAKSDHVSRMVIRHQKQRENISEELRILYVALTRAVDRLYLVGTVSDHEKMAGMLSLDPQKNVPKNKSFLSWIASALARDKKGEALRNLAEQELLCTMDEKETNYHIALIKGDELIENAENLAPKQNLADLEKPVSEENFALLEKYHRYIYPFELETKTVSKTSVTELTKEYKNRERDDVQSFAAIKRPNFSKSKKFSSSEVGTIVHFLMESITIQLHDATSLENEIEQMVQKELLTPQEAEAIPREAILRFFHSPLGQRMIASGKVYREQSFLMKENNLLVEGVIDCYFVEDDEIVILDYKTDWQMDENKHRPQLESYVRAVEAMEQKKVKEAFIYWISHDELTKIL